MFNFHYDSVTDQINDANKAHAINNLAILMILMEKSIITNAEYLSARAKATHEVDQEFARKKEKAEKEFKEENPALAELLGRMFREDD